MSKSKQNLIAAIPYISLVTGTLLFCYGLFGTFEYESKWKELLQGLGKTILAGGIFALLLKTIQFMGVFKDELIKVIYHDPKFLEKRQDLETIWINTSKAMFKNKFPSISSKLLNDITRSYFPISHSIYYDDLEHHIRIEYADASKNAVSVSYSSSLNVISTSQKDKCEYSYRSVLTFKHKKEEVFLDTKIKVEKQPVTPKIETKTEGNTVSTTYTIPLTGSEKYRVEREDVRKYNLDDDNMFYFGASKIINKLKVVVRHPTDLTVVFKKCGTISEFDLRRNNDDYKEFNYTDINISTAGIRYYIQQTIKSHSMKVIDGNIG